MIFFSPLTVERQSGKLRTSQDAGSCWMWIRRCSWKMLGRTAHNMLASKIKYKYEKPSSNSIGTFPKTQLLKT